jgi:TetR/AcrR family transcriptional regulator
MENNRKALADAALEAFSDQGYDSVGVQQIADAVGVGKPTLYHYFKSKEGLLRALFDTWCSQDLQMLEKTAGTGKDLPSILYDLAGQFCRLAWQDPRFYRLMISLFYAGRHSDAYRIARPYLLRVETLLVTVFESSADRLGNMNGRQRQFAHGYLGMLFEFLFSRLQDGKIAEDREVRLLVHQFMHGIYS